MYLKVKMEILKGSAGAAKGLEALLFGYIGNSQGMEAQAERCRCVWCFV